MNPASSLATATAAIRPALGIACAYSSMARAAALGIKVVGAVAGFEHVGYGLDTLETQMNNRIGTVKDRLEKRISRLESKVDRVAKHFSSQLAGGNNEGSIGDARRQLLWIPCRSNHPTPPRCAEPRVRLAGPPSVWLVGL